MTRHCQFCRVLLCELADDGRLDVKRPFLVYGAKGYCVKPCWDKIQTLAVRTRGVL